MDVEPGNISLNKLLFHLYYNPPGHACQEQNVKTFLFLSFFITFLGREFNIMLIIGLYPTPAKLGCFQKHGESPGESVLNPLANPY
jgi:hypothetical protein